LVACSSFYCSRAKPGKILRKHREFVRALQSPTRCFSVSSSTVDLHKVALCAPRILTSYYYPTTDYSYINMNLKVATLTLVAGSAVAFTTPNQGRPDTSLFKYRPTTASWKSGGGYGGNSWSTPAPVGGTGSLGTGYNPGAAAPASNGYGSSNDAYTQQSNAAYSQQAVDPYTQQSNMYAAANNNNNNNSYGASSYTPAPSNPPPAYNSMPGAVSSSSGPAKNYAPTKWSPRGGSSAGFGGNSFGATNTGAMGTGYNPAAAAPISDSYSAPQQTQSSSNAYGNLAAEWGSMNVGNPSAAF
jgi:hypothetical protein